MEAEITGMLPQTKKYPGLPVTGRSKKGSSPRDGRGSLSPEHIDFGFLVSEVR